MRIVLTVGLIVLALTAAALTNAQSRNETKKKGKQPAATEPQKSASGEDKRPAPGKPTTALTSRALVSRLQMEVDSQTFRGPMKFREFISAISEQLQARNSPVTINVDTEAFLQILGPDTPSPFEEQIVIVGNRKQVAVLQMMKQAVKQIGAQGGAIVIRAGRVDIVPVSMTTKEYMLNQTFRAEFKDQRLEEVLEEISDLTGVSIVLDSRAKEKARTTVSARLNDDVAMQDAVRMLTDMAELKMVYLVTGIYVTTPEHAKVLQKELKDLYEPKAPGGPTSLPGGLDPNMFGPAPFVSPLAPPLPPAIRSKRLEAAA